METIKNEGRLVIGIVMIVVGVVFMFESLGILDFSLKYYILSWKTFLIFLGLILFFNKKRKVSGIVLIALGLSFWFPSIFGVDVKLHQVFIPLLLIGIGALIVSKRGGVDIIDAKTSKINGETVFESDMINDYSIFGGSYKMVESKKFKGGTITSVFGSVELNLLNAEMDKEEGCVIDVFTLFGGTTLIVPADWKVKSDVLSILGGFNDKRRLIKSEIDSDKTLMIKGVVILGGIEIKSI